MNKIRLLGLDIDQKIKVKALWFDSNINAKGFIGAILSDGTPISLCSKEKWDVGESDSLRKGWNNDIKIFSKNKTIYFNISEDELKEQGLIFDMKVPSSLLMKE